MPQFAVLRSDTLEVITEGRDSREPISAVRFSPDGNSLAVASLDNKVRRCHSPVFSHAPDAELPSL